MDRSWVSDEGKVYIHANFAERDWVRKAIADRDPTFEYMTHDGSVYFPIEWLIDRETDADCMAIYFQKRHDILKAWREG